MARHYVRKTKKGDSYSKNDLYLAKEAVQSKQMTISSAAKLLNIPRPTLYDHINGRRGMKSNTMGRNTALGPQLEQKLANLIKTMDKYGHGLSRKEVLDLVGKYINANEIVSPFKNVYPNQDWWLGFSYRHNLSLKKPQVVECSRKKACNPKNNKRKKQADEAPVNETHIADINTENIIEQNLDSFDEDLDLNFSLDSDDNDLLNELQREEENLADERYLFRTTNNIGDWILVKYYVKEKSSNVKHYVGIIKEINDDMLKVRSVKLKSEDKNSTTFVYPIADDIDDVSDSNVVCCLPQPTVGRRSQLIFAITFSQYNLKK